MKTNRKTKPTIVYTHEGSPTTKSTKVNELRRTVFSCLLWENTFYEDGVSIADRIANLVDQIDNATCVQVAKDARNVHNLRHVPLWIICGLAKKGGAGRFVRDAINECVKRPDEITELVSLWWKDGKRPLTKAMKTGLASAFNRFNAYQLAKYNRKADIRLRDVMFLTHPTPKSDEQAEIFKKLANDTLESPDTWEVALSSGADKKETFERLIREGNLGYFALLRNLRNMVQSNCDLSLVKNAILAKGNGAEKILPFRYVAAARACPELEPELDQAMMESINELPKLTGKTIVLVDVSGSMEGRLSAKSDMTRMDAACALASIVNTEHLEVFSFSNNIVKCPTRKGMAGIDAVRKSQGHGGTELGKAVQHINSLNYDRLIVITDEQSHDYVASPKSGARGYMINVASYENGINYGNWTRINGFSENVLKFIYELENFNDG